MHGQKTFKKMFLHFWRTSAPSSGSLEWLKVNYFNLCTMHPLLYV